VSLIACINGDGYVNDDRLRRSDSSLSQSSCANAPHHTLILLTLLPLLFNHRSVSCRYCFAGLITIYEYYAYPDNVRPRLSQVLVLPPFQRAGHGAELLRAAYAYCARAYDKGKVIDVTVEDPSPNFSRLRDKVDVENCWRAFPDKDFWLGQWDDTKAAAIREKLLLGKAQARRVFEILQLHALNSRDPAVLRPYRLAIKKRLIQPHKVSPPFSSPTATAVPLRARLRFQAPSYTI